MSTGRLKLCHVHLLSIMSGPQRWSKRAEFRCRDFANAWKFSIRRCLPTPHGAPSLPTITRQSKAWRVTAEPTLVKAGQLVATPLPSTGMNGQALGRGAQKQHS